MCFGSSSPQPISNPAPTPLDETQLSVTKTAAPATGQLGAQAMAKDAKDTQRTAPVTGYGVTTGLQTATL